MVNIWLLYVIIWLMMVNNNLVGGATTMDSNCRGDYNGIIMGLYGDYMEII